MKTPRKRLSHIDESGRAAMVNVTEKTPTARRAVARGWLVVSGQGWAAARSGNLPKGNIEAVARVAGIMGAKQTAALIPLCHPLALSGITVDIAVPARFGPICVTATVDCTGPTGVEMEALTAVSVALLALYDMLKAVDHEMRLSEIELLEKSGGKTPLRRRGSLPVRSPRK